MDLNILKEFSNLISKAITNAYEETEKTIKASYKNVDDKIEAIQLYAINIVREIDKITEMKKKENQNCKKDYQELPQYIILKDRTKKDCPVVLESKYAEEALNFIIPLIGKGINFDPAANYPSIDKQKQWFEENLRKYGYFGIDDGFYSPVYILSYRENKDYEDK